MSCQEDGEQLFSTVHPHCIERDPFLSFSTVKFGGLDYHIKQPHKTLLYTKALQFWVEKAQLPMPG